MSRRITTVTVKANLSPNIATPFYELSNRFRPTPTSQNLLSPSNRLSASHFHCSRMHRAPSSPTLVPQSNHSCRLEDSLTLSLVDFVDTSLPLFSSITSAIPSLCSFLLSYCTSPNLYPIQNGALYLSLKISWLHPHLPSQPPPSSQPRTATSSRSEPKPLQEEIEQ